MTTGSRWVKDILCHRSVKIQKVCCKLSLHQAALTPNSACTKLRLHQA
jgi:hypothetical protein